MHRLKNKGIVVLTVIGLFALSGVAVAATAESDDTVGNYYYDTENDFLMFNVTSDEEFESFEALKDTCELDGLYNYSYDGEIDLSEPVHEDCSDLIGDFAYGPNGQINHGTIMKLINGLYDGPQRGCVIREFARTNLGKTDQQGPVPNFETPDASADPIGSDGFTFENFTTNCLHGADEVGDDDGNGGPPPHAAAKGKAKWLDGKPGKSGSAPGHNKGD